jgi:hypothetical protein
MCRMDRQTLTAIRFNERGPDGLIDIPSRALTCSRFAGPIFAGKSQFSGCLIRAVGRGKNHEEIEVFRCADCFCGRLR